MHKNPLFNFALIFLALVVGYGVGKRGEPASHPLRPFEKVENPGDNSVDYKEKYLSLKNRFDQINKIDIEEYLSLKSQKEKYNKANEILGKILVIFLAELGLKVSGEVRDYTEGVTNSPEKYAYEESLERGENEKSQIVEKETFANLEEKKKKEWFRNERSINHISSMDEATIFLEKVELKKFSQSISKSIPIKRSLLKILRGVYTGELIYTDASKGRVIVEMEINGRVEKHKGKKIVMGKSSIKLIKDGKTMSSSSGDGMLEDYRSLAKDSVAIIVRMGGKTGYFQLYYARSMDQFIGNYYADKSFGKYSKKGTVFLERR